MKKQKYFVVNPWRKGMRVGETFETENLHPALTNHVRLVVEEEEEKPEIPEPPKSTKK